MDRKHQAIRAQISVMCHDRAVDYIKAFHLTEKEETCLIEKDVNDLSYTQISRKFGFSPEVIKESRRRAYSKIADGIEYAKEKGREG